MIECVECHNLVDLTEDSGVLYKFGYVCGECMDQWYNEYDDLSKSDEICKRLNPTNFYTACMEMEKEGLIVGFTISNCMGKTIVDIQFTENGKNFFISYYPENDLDG